MNIHNGNYRSRILLVDDDEDLLHLVSVRLRASGYQVRAVNSGEDALVQVGIFQPDAVVTDLKMAGMDGMALFEAIQDQNLGLPVIILTANGTISDAVTATRQGVFSYLEKPVAAEVLLGSLEKALTHSLIVSGTAGAPAMEQWRSKIISRSPLMDQVLKQAKAAASADSNILIQGETGTGKEELAVAVHRASIRHKKPFIAFNCAAIPEALLESELFGHVAGAFTGARRANPGLFQAANGGTVFLDEIGDMPLTAQAKVLRVLELREVRPVGAVATVPVDIRVIAATHHSLASKVAQGDFREDLFYRLNVLTLEVPALRQRREDILPLAEHFCRAFAERNDRLPARFTPEAAELLLSVSWPGNVRQLCNIAEQCSVLTTTPLISRSLVERALRFRPQRLLGLNQARDQFEFDYLVRMLNLTQGNISLAARLAERNRSEFYNLLKKHGLDPARFRRENDVP
jgi:two-component system, NtrC family, response regulator GlrR